jgi:sugar lactone lactonase YvrE
MKSIHYPLFFLLSILFFGCGGQQETAQQEETTADTVQTEAVTLEQVWATDTVMRTPESVLYDEARDVIYVANINTFTRDSKDGDGFIAKLSPEGEVVELEWVTGLNDPKGMGVHENTLFVADIDEIVAIDVETGEIQEKHAVEGASFLNDITVGSDGTVYATDSDNNNIHALANGEVTLWLSDTAMQRPNGLLMEDDQLLLASAGGGFFAPIDPESKTIGEPWVTEIPSADGIAKDENGNYIVSCWAGEIYYVQPDNTSQKLLDTKAQEINAADIDYAAEHQLLLVPTFNDNRIVAYTLN